MVEADLNMQINETIRQAGSEEALEKYFNKSMVEIRRDIRSPWKATPYLRFSQQLLQT